MRKYVLVRMIFITNNEELKHDIHWIVPNSQKNRMEPIIVYLKGGGKTFKEDPHEGEEFGYVISGSIYLNLGNRKIRVKRRVLLFFTRNRSLYREYI